MDRERHAARGSVTVDIILIAGLWLDGSAWSEVANNLVTLGHRPVPLWLPGQGGESSNPSLAAHLAAVVAAIDQAATPPMVVGHSAAASLAWLAVDARPDRVANVVLLGGFPRSNGQAYFDDVPPVDGLVHFPGWEAFEGPSTADLDEAMRARITADMHPVPEAVVRATVQLRDERRFRVPVVVACPEFSAADATSWVDAGEVPELTHAHDVRFIDLECGHWPMYSQPDRLARVLADLTQD